MSKPKNSEIRIPEDRILASVGTANYEQLNFEAPELDARIPRTSALGALRSLLLSANLDCSKVGTKEWNPLGDLIPIGARVVLKPNWVLHENHSGKPLESLITHPSVIVAVLSYLIKVEPRQIVIGDAPVQGCDFNRLLANSRLSEWLEPFGSMGIKIEVVDFRLMALPGGKLGAPPLYTGRTEQDCVLFDLGRESALEPITSIEPSFRVTMYDPDALGKAHSQGRHQYLIAKEVVGADVVINLPKLKTHKKACITGAIKNVVGINVLKDYLPHHRKGPPSRGGDCYPQESELKWLAENLLDRVNRMQGGFKKRLGATVAGIICKVADLQCRAFGIEGSWYGNDTVWRMALDLHRVLRYGKVDGVIASTSQRDVITITDAIIAGEGDGPLSVNPVPLGLITLGTNVAALEWFHSLVMGFDPKRIPIVREASYPSPFSLSQCGTDKVEVVLNGRSQSLLDMEGIATRSFDAPAGWKGHCELGAMAKG